MRLIVLPLVFLISFIASDVCAQALYVTWPPQIEVVEGEAFSLEWSAGGAETVVVAISGTRTPLGGQSRGEFSYLIGKVPAAQCALHFTVPWIDSLVFLVKIKAYNNAGKLLGKEERSYRFRPAVLANRRADGIYLDLHLRINQRLYVQKDGKLTHAYLTTSSAAYNWVYSPKSPRRIHDHAGVFSILSKTRYHWSSQFNVAMLRAMRYHEGHFIHATPRTQYYLLGRPASHGCNRLTLQDAKQLYEMTPLGTRVEIIGPKG
ncbi:MAG: L,D-transpeptidase [Armatimonadetes bacterium]|nr:L,D-transpeptidase [Armatimonadota bacterium]